MVFRASIGSIITVCSFFFCTSCFAQSALGLTRIPDTSFSIQKEFIRHQKKYPQIKVADGPISSGVKRSDNITYCRAGGKELKLDVFRPAKMDNNKRPAVMIIFGGGWRSGNRAQHHPLAQRLADLGYVCFTPDYRLSTHALYPAAVHDLKAALRWIHANATKYHVDTSRIAVMGFSAGGQLAALLGTTNGNPYFEGKECNLNYSSEVDAIIDLDGTLSFVHPESGEGDDSKKPSAATLWFGYSRKENPALWKEASPLKWVSSHTPPTLFINSGVARMHAGRDDFIKVLQANNIYTDVKTFDDAPHSFVFFQPWFDPMVGYVDRFLQRVFNTISDVPSKQQDLFARSITVAKDGSGQFTSVQAAFNSIPAGNSQPVLVFVKNGIYYEKIHLDSLKRFVTLVGEDKFNTILTYNDHTGKRAPSGEIINTRTSWSFKIEADNFTARNITFQNDAGFSAGQAVAVESNGDQAVFRNCRFLGNQDVLFTNSDRSRQYFEKCYIEGTTDFIFGSSTAWFEQCHIHSKKNSHVTAAATPEQNEFGYVFYDCVLTADSSLNKVSLGRPWRPFASVTYIYCYIDKHIIPEGWNNWGKVANEQTARYAEYRNYGPGSSPAKRAPWARQLNDIEARAITRDRVLRGWEPVR